MLSRLRMTVRDCIEEYKALCPRIFGRPRFVTELHFGLFGVHRTKYDTDAFRRILEDVASKRDEIKDGHTNFRIQFGSSRKDLCKT